MWSIRVWLKVAGIVPHLKTDGLFCRYVRVLIANRSRTPVRYDRCAFGFFVFNLSGSLGALNLTRAYVMRILTIGENGVLNG